MKADYPLVSLETLPLDGGSKRRLSSTLSRLRRDETKPLFDDRVIEVALAYAFSPKDVQRVLTRLSRIRSSTDGLPFGRSVGTYSSMQEIWAKFAAPEKPSFLWNQKFQMAIQIVKARYSRARLSKIRLPKTPEEARDLLSDWTTSGGYESIVSGKRSKGEMLDEAYIRTLPDKVAEAIETGRFDYPIVPGFRTQCSELPGLDCKHKKRPVNMVTMLIIILESLYANPITQWLSDYPYSAIGKDDYQTLPTLISRHRALGRSWLSLDYSSYDATIPSWLIRTAFEILRGMFPCLSEEDGKLWDAIVQSFIVKDLITPDGILHVTHGNPSGSKFTAIINGVCNEIMTEYWAILLNKKVEYIIMGDDNLIFFKTGSISQEEVDRIADVLSSKIGIKVNAQKSTMGKSTDAPHFLSREWRDVGAWRSPDELISLLAYPERFRDYKRSSVLTPELIIFSYILSCRAGMAEWFDVNRFVREHQFRMTRSMWTKEVLREVPWTVRYRVELENLGIARRLMTGNGTLRIVA